MLEEPGPWGSEALLDSRLPSGLGAALKQRAGSVRARMLLIRRHGRRRPGVLEQPRRTCLVAVTSPSVWWVEKLALAAPADLLDVDWTPLASDQSLGGQRLDRPVYLVCTNGRYDRCCAEYGRPLAAALMPSVGGDLWESSHYGGDRFAANLVCLPHGLYFGHLDSAVGPRIAEAYAQGRIDLAHYRGRSCYPFEVQAAEYFLRDETGLVGVEDLRWDRWARLGNQGALVEFSNSAGRRFAVTIGISDDPDGRVLSCRGSAPAHPRSYRLLGLEPGS
jgi:hypothetical protein